MKPSGLESVSIAMATKCFSGVTMTTDHTVHMRSNRRNAYANHRKSAVELLEASKGEYVKSTVVLNHRQELKHPENFSVGNREILSLPISATRLSPSEDSNNTDIDSGRHRTISGSECSSYSTADCQEAVRSQTGSESSTKNREKSRDRQDTRQSPPSLHSSKTSVESNSCQATSSHIAVARQYSVSSSVSETSGYLCSGKRPSLTTSLASAVSVDSSAKRHSVTSEVSNAANTSLIKRPSLTYSSNSESPSLGKKSSLTVSSSASQSADHGHSSVDKERTPFREPIAPPPRTPNKPAVPPKPGCTTKPITPPKPGPKPDISNTEKPVPPPRPPRRKDTLSHSRSLDDTVNSSVTSTMASKQSSAAVGSQASGTSPTSGDKSSKDQSGKSKLVAGHESRHSLHGQADFLKPLCATSLSVSVGVLVESKKTPVPKPRGDKEFKEVALPRRRHLHRSQSDLSNCRHSRTSSDFSDISSRLSRTSTEVERFFNEMGIDHSVLEPMRRLADTNRHEVFQSLSSFGSLDGHSLSSRLSNDLDRVPMESEQDLSSRDSGATSVVERNARIIKWLCNVKKARTVQTKPQKSKPDVA